MQKRLRGWIESVAGFLKLFVEVICARRAGKKVHTVPGELYSRVGPYSRSTVKRCLMNTTRRDNERFERGSGQLAIGPPHFRQGARVVVRAFVSAHRKHASKQSRWPAQSSFSQCVSNTESVDCSVA